MTEQRDCILLLEEKTGSRMSSLGRRAWVGLGGRLGRHQAYREDKAREQWHMEGPNRLSEYDASGEISLRRMTVVST